MFERLLTLFIFLGASDNWALWLARATSIIVVLLVVYMSYFSARLLIRRILQRITDQTKTNWDDKLFEYRVLAYISMLAPLVVLAVLAPVALEGPQYDSLLRILQYIIFGAIIVVILLALLGTVNAVIDIAQDYEFAKQVPLHGLAQLTKIVLIFIGGLLLVSIFVGQNPLALLSGLGAITAVLSFVYQDALRGLVAGIQLTASGLLARGDIIEMPSYDVSGTVLEVGLTTLKVQNFDFTITTVPTYSLISSSFKNWKGMDAAGGRRWKKQILIDASSVEVLNDSMLAQLGKVELLDDYLPQRLADVTAHNLANHVNTNININGRQLTNLGTFRAYLVAYLRNHPLVPEDMSVVVRQLSPTSAGLPIEMVAFCREKSYVPFEAFQADVIDHILVAAPVFKLKIFQTPTGYDMGMR